MEVVSRAGGLCKARKQDDQGTALHLWGQADIMWVNTSHLRCKGKGFSLSLRSLFTELSWLLEKDPFPSITGEKKQNEKKKKALIVNVNTTLASNYMFECFLVNVQNWIFEFSSGSLILGSCDWYGLAVNFENFWIKQKWHTLNLPFNKETRDKNRNYKADHTVVSAHSLFWLGKPGTWSCRRKKPLQKIRVSEMKRWPSKAKRGPERRRGRS